MFYRLPAEWEEQKSTLIAWPYNKSDWPKRFDNIPSVFAKNHIKDIILPKSKCVDKKQ